MATTWVLIIAISHGVATASVATQEFGSQAACESAKKAFLEATVKPPPLSFSYHNSVLVCVNKN